MSTVEFIKKVTKVHNSKYDYSKTNYINCRTKVIIICPVHGEFEQRPSNHLSGQGCPNCGIIQLTNKQKFNIEQFIKKANQIHNNKYDYNKVNYVNSQIKVTITCPEHGDFEQIPNSHLSGHGCPKCMYEKNSKQFRSNLQEFIKRAKTIHSNRFDYSKVKYITSKIKVIILCPEHGKFTQTPHSHLKGQGCPKCQSSKGELVLEAIFKKYNILYKPQHRIPEVCNELYYDFYLPEYNLLIEFHGIQHYEYIPFFHVNDRGWDFAAQKRRDDCIRHNAFIYKYNYLEFNYKQLKHLSEKEFEKMVINNIKKGACKC